jgi:exodeoxyribonuclease V alpha subunit
MMKNNTEPENITGTIESIVFYSPDTGYTVCRFSAEGGDQVTIIGNFPPLSPGEVLKVSGTWEMNPRFGRQLRVENFSPVLPSSEKGIEKFLSSGLILGIGPVLARRIVAKFGPDTIDILSSRPDKLKQVEGVGQVKLREIKKSWAEHEDIRELIIFLQEHNISTTLATKIYKQYGKNSFHVLKTNPYQACHDIWGVGFKTADQIALKLGMSPTAPERVKAYIVYLLEKDNEQGHVFTLEKDMLESCCGELEVSQEQAAGALAALITEKLVVTEDAPVGKAVYLPFFKKAEDDVVHYLERLASFSGEAPAFDVDEAIAEVEKGMGIRFSPLQKEAIGESLRTNILVITGGPGTGKTTIIKAVVDIFRRWERSVLLAAPTGRAAKRLSEATGKEAKTLHRTLEFVPKLGKFRRDEGYPLKADALIIDEFSMVDLPLMYHLMKAVPRWLRLILVGDKDQLPSVGPGTLLRDIIGSGRIPVVRLDEIFRQERESLIVLNAHQVNHGNKLVFPEKGDRDADFYFMYKEDESEAFQTIMSLCSSRIPQKLSLDPLSPQIQVISPMYRGLVGVDNLNRELQKKLNPLNDGLQVGNREFRLRDKVMQVRNNYDKDVYNGDIGAIKDFDRKSYTVVVDFDGRSVAYAREAMNELVHAYAVSVHKSQGSEYQAVVIPLMTQHYIMLQRNLFYTALTRAKKLSCVVGTYKALHIAIQNDKPVKRNGLLAQKLKAAVEPVVP